MVDVRAGLTGTSTTPADRARAHYLSTFGSLRYMPYCGPGTNFDDVVRHLRNKNFALYPVRSGLLIHLADRLYAQSIRLRYRSLRRTGWKAVVSEQIVEGALVLRHLKPGERKILDFGGYESLLPLTLSALGHEVTVLDGRLYPFTNPRLHTVCGDLFGEHGGLEGAFDVVISVSTIEHLGLGRYGDTQTDDGDRRGVERLWSFVRPGGRLMVTVPAGRPTVQRGYRVYDESRVRATFPQPQTLLWFKKDGREGTWAPTDAQGIASLAYSEPFAAMPAEGVAFIICEKPA